MTEACQNCKAHGAEWVPLRQGKERVTYWSSCRKRPPEIGSKFIGAGPSGDAWAGLHPWVPYGHWCADHTQGDDSTAASIEFGELNLRPKQPKE